MIGRRELITGIFSMVAAPAVVRVSSLMACSPTEILTLHPDDIVGYSDHELEWVIDNIQHVIVDIMRIPRAKLFGMPANPLTATELADLGRYAARMMDIYRGS